jgi:hypothetical protein
VKHQGSATAVTRMARADRTIAHLSQKGEVGKHTIAFRCRLSAYETLSFEIAD